jgi:hypothetical protein
MARGGGGATSRSPGKAGKNTALVTKSAPHAGSEKFLEFEEHRMVVDGSVLFQNTLPTTGDQTKRFFLKLALLLSIFTTVMWYRHAQYVSSLVIFLALIVSLQARSWPCCGCVMFGGMLSQRFGDQELGTDLTVLATWLAVVAVLFAIGFLPRDTWWDSHGPADIIGATIVFLWMLRTDGLWFGLSAAATFLISAPSSAADNEQVAAAVAEHESKHKERKQQKRDQLLLEGLRLDRERNKHLSRQERRALERSKGKDKDK